MNKVKESLEYRSVDIDGLQYVPIGIALAATEYARELIDTNNMVEVKVNNTSFVSIPSGFDVKVGDKLMLIKKK